MKIVIDNETLYFNDMLIKKQKLNKKDIKKIINLHEKKIKIFNKMKNLDPISNLDLEKLIKYSFKINKLDLEAQKAWKFEKNEKMLTWWFQVPYCICNKEENLNILGKGKVINPNCFIHGIKSKLIVLNEKSIFN